MHLVLWVSAACECPTCEKRVAEVTTVCGLPFTSNRGGSSSQDNLLPPALFGKPFTEMYTEKAELCPLPFHASHG